MIETIDEVRGSAIVPAPALAELLVGAGAQRAAMLRALEGRRAVRVVPFDKMAAIHCANLDAQAISEGDKRDGVRSSWQKVKIDRQIVATAQVARCEQIITGDPDVEKIAGRAAIETMFVWELDLPPEDTQQELNLEREDEPPAD